MQAIEQSCFWLAERRQPSAPPIGAVCPRFTQVVIVGAGFTGLWAAYFLRQLNADLDIVVVEQGVTGYGASGRNAGMISNCIDHSHGLAINHFGIEEARQLASLGLANICELAEFARDCDLEMTGQLTVALTERQAEGLEALVEAAALLGIEGYRIFDSHGIRKKLNSPLYMGGAYVPGGGIINPVKLIDRLVDWLRARSVIILEHTAVSAVAAHGVETAVGPIGAETTILATDAYSHHLMPALLNHFIPLYDYVIVSAPLTEGQLSLLGWQGREGVMDCRNFFNYYRLTADNRVLWGTSEAQYYAPNLVDRQFDGSDAHSQRLKESFASHFPQLADLVWTHSWGGPIAATTRLTPFFGSAYEGKVHYALGYTGHGLGSARLAGRILAHMALGIDSPLLKLQMVTALPVPYPPEPLRSLAVRMVTGSMRKVDRGFHPGLMLKLLDGLGIGFSS